MKIDYRDKEESNKMEGGRNRKFYFRNSFLLKKLSFKTFQM